MLLNLMAQAVNRGALYVSGRAADSQAKAQMCKLPAV